MAVILDHEGKPLSEFCEFMADMGHRAYKGAKGLDGPGCLPWQRMYQPEDETFLRDRKAVETRAREAYRNDSQIKGAVDDKVRLIFGNRWSVVPVLDGEELGYTVKQTQDLSRYLRKKFNREMYSRAKNIDASGKMNLIQLLMLHKRIEIITGESFLKINRFDPRRSPFGFNIQLTDGGRIDTPADKPNDPSISHGIRSAASGLVEGCYVHRYHVGSKLNVRGPQLYSYVPYRTDLGSTQMVHSYVPTHADQTRGISQLATMLLSSQKKDKMVDYSMEDFIAKAQIALVIKSDKSDIAEAFGLNTDEAHDMKEKTMSNFNHYMDNSKAWHHEMDIKYGNEQLLRLYDGESLDGFSPMSSGGSLQEFLDSMNSIDSRSMGLSREHFTQKWNDIAYTGARAGQLTVKRTTEEERINVIDTTHCIYDTWLEDGILRGTIDLPDSGSRFRAYEAFVENRDALTSIRCDGPAWDEIDQTKTAKKYETDQKLGVATFDRYARQVLGENADDILDQKFIELEQYNLRLENAGYQRVTDPTKFIFSDFQNMPALAQEQSTVEQTAVETEQTGNE